MGVPSNTMFLSEATLLALLFLAGCDSMYPVYLENQTDRTIRARGAGNGLSETKWGEVRPGRTAEAFSAFQAPRCHLDIEVDESRFQLAIRPEDKDGAMFSVILSQEELDKRVPCFRPNEGYVPDTETAQAIAEAVLNRVYGREQVENQLPLTAALKDGFWIVTGTMKSKATLGGVVLVVIAKDDGRIVRMSHSK